MQCYKPTMNARDTANVIDELLHKITETAQILIFFPRLRGSLSSTYYSIPKTGYRLYSLPKTGYRLGVCHA